MPFFRAGSKLVFYAHVPKCGGSAVADYVRDRFGHLGLHDNHYLRQPPDERWSRTSPQHVDVATLTRLVPLDMFDACFAVVRHPISRAISTYHFQLELEGSVPAGTTFGEWLRQVEDQSGERYAYDNHVRPMADLVPLGATVFHLEHGLDGLVPWFDALAGQADGPREIGELNKRGEHVKVQGARARPTDEDLARLARVYADDFERFGYRVGERQPLSLPPAVTRAFVDRHERAFHALHNPIARLRRRIRRKVSQWIW